jgi:hypothetical protein
MWPAVAIALIAFGLIGCPSPPPPASPLLRPAGSSGVFPHRNLMHWYVAPAGKVAAVVFTDGVAASGNGGVSERPTGVYLGSITVSANGDTAEWMCRAEPDGTGAVMFAGESYDLADGRVFLLHAAKRGSKIVQLRRDLRGVEPKEEGLEAFADADPEVAAFLTAASR